MLSLGDAHVNLEELEAQFGGASFKLDVFYQDGQPEPEADMDPSSPFMPLDAGAPFFAKPQSPHFFDAAVGKAAATPDEPCAVADEPQLGRCPTATVCIGHLCSSSLSLLEAEGEFRRQEAVQRLRHERSLNRQLRAQLQEAREAEAAALQQREAAFRTRDFLRQCVEALQENREELRGELAWLAAAGSRRGPAPPPAAPAPTPTPKAALRPAAPFAPAPPVLNVGSREPLRWPAPPTTAVPTAPFHRPGPPPPLGFARQARLPVPQYAWAQVVA
eukprot:EG_transcript_10032